MSIDWKALAAPFDDVSWRVQGAPEANKSCKVVAYIDARDVQDRLDDVAGPENWSFDWELISKKGDEVYLVKGILTICGVMKTDIGEAGNIEKSKGAVSDALKRAAVHFGVARYLYGTGEEWVTLDQYKHIPSADIVRLNKKIAASLERQKAAQARQNGQQPAQRPTAPVPTVTPSESQQNAPQVPAQISDSQWVNAWCKQRNIAPVICAEYSKMVGWGGVAAIKAQLEKNGDDIAIVMEDYAKEKKQQEATA